MADRAFDVIVVGGGAAGLVASIAAKKNGAKTALIEKNIRVGKKILATGNGRCNLSNTCIGEPRGASQYNNPSFVKPILERMSCEGIRSVFNDLGLLTITDKSGWVFPRTRTANTVVDVLMEEIERLDIPVYTGEEAIGIRSSEDGFRVETSMTGYSCRSLVLTCGVQPILRSFDYLRFIEPAPILGPLKTDTNPIRGLDGIRVVSRILLTDGVDLLSWQDGELLFRDYGVSGIAVFNLSRFAKPGHKLYIDFFPEMDENELKSLLSDRMERFQGNLSLAELLSGMLHSRVIHAIVRKANLKLSDKMDDAVLTALVFYLKAFSIDVLETPAKGQAQVTRGGLDTADFNPETLSAYRKQNLFAAGESLDIDGPCGGFNLHWAWASGLTAGANAALTSRNQRERLG